MLIKLERVWYAYENHKRFFFVGVPVSAEYFNSCRLHLYISIPFSSFRLHFSDSSDLEKKIKKKVLVHREGRQKKNDPRLLSFVVCIGPAGLH